MNSSLRFFTLICLAVCMNTTESEPIKCACQRPRPQPVVAPKPQPQPVVVAPQNTVKAQEDMVKRLETICSNFLYDVNNAMQDSKCPCNRPRPRTNNDEVRTLLRECCEVLLQEAQQTANAELEEKVLNVMKSMQQMEENRHARSCRDERARSDADESIVVDVDNSEILLNMVQKQQAHNDQVVDLLNNVVLALQERCLN